MGDPGGLRHATGPPWLTAEEKFNLLATALLIVI